MEEIRLNPDTSIQGCNKCGKILPLLSYYKSNWAKSGFSPTCKQCTNAHYYVYTKTEKGKAAKKRHDAKYSQSHQGKINRKKYFTSEKGKANIKKYRQTDKYKAYVARYREQNKDKNKLRSIEYRKTPKGKAVHREFIQSGKNKQNHKKYYERHKNDMTFKINSIISWHIGHSLKGNKNGKEWESIVGYTLKDLMRHLEKHFIDGMSWNNYGNGDGKWHIDHIIPISAFYFTDYTDSDFQRCWALKNLQPLWGKDNLSKNAKITRPFQPRLDLPLTKHLLSLNKEFK
jgi:hypothetical protein